MSATSDLSPAKAKSLRKSLAEQLTASTLPGETGLANATVENVAEFLLEAAQKRRPSRAVLTHESDTSERRLRRADEGLEVVHDRFVSPKQRVGVGR